MRNWRNSLQSKAMRNLVLGMFVLNTAGTYAAYVKLNQPVPDAFTSSDQTTPVAYSELEPARRPIAELPPVPRRQLAWESKPMPLPSLKVIPDATLAPIDVDRADDPAPEARPDVVKPAARPERLARLERAASHLPSGFDAAFSAGTLAADSGASLAADAGPSLSDQPVGPTPMAIADGVSSAAPAAEPAPVAVAIHDDAPARDAVAQPLTQDLAAPLPTPTTLDLPATAGTQG